MAKKMPQREMVLREMQTEVHSMTHDEFKKVNEQIDNLEDIADMIVIKKGATNGEVIEAVFNNDAFINFLLSYEDHYWWDAPYKGGTQHDD